MRNKGKRVASPLSLAACAAAIVLAVGGTAYAISQYLTDFEAAYPAAVGSQLDHCVLCHIDPNGGGARNPYGSDFANAAIGNHTFNGTLGGTDSDGDGFTNDEEIAALTFPGDNTSFPSAVDNTAPTVTSVVPANNATGVATNTLVSATFSEAIDNTTVTDTSFVVTDPTDNVVAGTIAVSADNTTATFTSQPLLADNTVYTATLTTAITDLAGNPLADNVVWSFTTAAAAMDTTPPTVQSISPTDGATGVTTTTAVSVTFSEPVDQATVDNTSFVVTDPTDNVVAGTFGFAGDVVQFSPSAALAASTTYTATLTTAITDLAGNPLADNVVWSFTTAAAATDTTPPTVQGTSPADGATGVTTTTAVTAAFSEAVDQVTVDNTSFVLTDPTDNVVAGTFGFAGDVVQFTPSAVLAPSTTYTATLTTAITDLAGNPLADNVVWSFTTAAPSSSESNNDNGGGCSVTGRSEGFGGGATLALLTLFVLFVATRRRRARGRR